MSHTAHAETLTARRSARLVSWARAWRAGIVSFDEMLDAIIDDEEQHIDGLPGSVHEMEMREALPAMAKLHPDEIRLVLPAPGDPRGLPGPGVAFTERALLAGEGVIASRLGLIPEERVHTSGSGVTFITVLWHAFDLPQAPAPCYVDVAEADSHLSVTLAEATTELVRLDVAQWRPELAGALQALRKPGPESDLPAGYQPRARRLYARACVLDRVLTLAGQTTGAAVNTTEMRLREQALRPLATACRQALVAACNSPLSA
jgi:hypothetical protein